MSGIQLLIVWFAIGWSFAFSWHIFKEGKKNAKSYGKPVGRSSVDDDQPPSGLH
jgi:hypothetical protein